MGKKKGKGKGAEAGSSSQQPEAAKPQPPQEPEPPKQPIPQPLQEPQGGGSKKKKSKGPQQARQEPEQVSSAQQGHQRIPQQAGPTVQQQTGPSPQQAQQSPWGAQSQQQPARGAPPQQAWGAQQQPLQGQPQPTRGQPQPAWGAQPQPTRGAQAQPAQVQQQPARGAPPQQAWGAQQQPLQGQPKPTRGQPQPARGPQPQSPQGQPQPAMGAQQQPIQGQPQQARGVQPHMAPPQQGIPHPQQAVYPPNMMPAGMHLQQPQAPTGMPPQGFPVFQQTPQNYPQTPVYQQMPQQIPPGIQQFPPGIQQIPPGYQQTPQGSQQIPPAAQDSPAQAGGGVQGGKKGKKKGAQPEQKPSMPPGDPRTPVQKKPGPAPPTAEMGKLDIEPIPMIKATPGIKGRKIRVETNHLKLLLGNLDTAIHYDVNLEPDTPKKFLRGVMEAFRQQHYPKRYPAFDGRKNLYSTSMLPFGDYKEGEVVIKDKEGVEKKYKVQVKFANEVDLRPLRNYELSRATPREALQVVDIVLRCAPAQSLISVGRSFFRKPPTILDLGEGMEMYNGFYQSAVRGWKPFLNVDVAHKAFPKRIPVVDAMCELFNPNPTRPSFSRERLSSPLDSYQVDTFAKFIKTLRVTYEIPGNPASRRVFRVNGINEPADKKRFKLDNGRETTIQEYFSREKKYRLRYPNLPTLWVGSMARKDNPILIPAELCIIEDGQVLNRKMTENQTSKMIKYAATNTETRKKKIIDGMREANHNSHPTVREFGFSVSDKFEELDARVLVPPVLKYLNNQVTPSRGVWRNDKFCVGVNITKWTIVCVNHTPMSAQSYGYLEKCLMDEARRVGIQMAQPGTVQNRQIRGTADSIKQFFTSVKNAFDVIFVVIPNSGPQYSFVKVAAEINSGCLTQCIKYKTASNINNATALNILLKVNAKLNGLNHFLQTRPAILGVPTMIMGADVTHPSPDSTNIPSVAAVTASYEAKAFKYNICCRLQPPTVEVIEDLENIVLEQLHYFKNVNNRNPLRIIFFRDGVSEGQFEEIRRAEIRAIRSACKRFEPTNYEPAITFLVVQKRHHTRLFPMNPRDSEDRNCNVPAGTCVDQQITHPFMQDFYLVSHASIQGVAKPTKYCTLWDDNNMSNDDIQELTYFLCHMFTRCNRSVSYPAPTYYAHLAAARAKVYIENQTLDLNRLSSHAKLIDIQDCIKKSLPMFFV